MINQLASVSSDAKIGEDVFIGPFTTIHEDVIIGARTKIHSNVSLYPGTRIGEDCEIFPGAVIGVIPQDLKFDGEDVELIIGDNNKIREYTLFNPGTQGGGSITKIGDNNLFMGYTHAAHDVIVGNNCVFANCATLAGHVEVDDYVVIGGLTPIHQFCKIGTQAMVAGGSVVTQDIPPFCLAEGNRAVLRGLNLNGLRRRLDSRKEIDEIKQAYKALFESNEPLSENARKIYDASENENVKNLTLFVLETKRGIPFNRK